MSTQISKRELLSKHALSAGLGVGALGLLPQRASADTPFTSFPFTATGAPTPRTMPDRLGEIKNVKDYGAVGDNVTDDTDAIQLCLNTAYSNGISSWLNKPVYFPAGRYKISRPIYILDSGGVHIFGAGANATQIRNMNVGTSGFAGTGTIYDDPADPGNSEVTQVLEITHVDSGTLYRGTIISGNGIMDGCVIFDFLTGTGGLGTYRTANHRATIPSTTITGNNNSVLFFNGVAYSTVEELTLECTPGGVAFEYNWGRHATSHWASQIVFVSHIVTGGGDYGCRIGNGGNQCDTSLFLDCYFGGHSEAGIKICNFNALVHNVYGGNFAQCKRGIWVTAGALQAASGIGFENYAEFFGEDWVNVWDIKIDGGAQNGVSITGCSSESSQFVYCGTAAVSCYISGCDQRGNLNGYFFKGGYGGAVTIENCASRRGAIYGGVPLTVSNCDFKRTDALDGYYGGPLQLAKIKNSIFGSALAKRIVNQTISSIGTRTYEIEAASLTDTKFLYEGVNVSGNTEYTPIEISIGSPADLGFGGTNDAFRHNFVAGRPIAFTTTGSLPNVIVAGKTYYVIAAGMTAFTFRISGTVGGPAVNTTGSQSGEHRCWLVRTYAVGDQVLNNTVAAGGSPGWICTTAGEALNTAVFKALPNVGR